jgi:hypothetical protein
VLRAACAWPNCSPALARTRVAHRRARRTAVARDTSCSCPNGGNLGARPVVAHRACDSHADTLAFPQGNTFVRLKPLSARQVAALSAHDDDANRRHEGGPRRRPGPFARLLRPLDDNAGEPNRLRWSSRRIDFARTHRQTNRHTHRHIVQPLESTRELTNRHFRQLFLSLRRTATALTHTARSPAPEQRSNPLESTTLAKQQQNATKQPRRRTPPPIIIMQIPSPSVNDYRHPHHRRRHPHPHHRRRHQDTRARQLSLSPIISRRHQTIHQQPTRFSTNNTRRSPNSSTRKRAS